MKRSLGIVAFALAAGFLASFAFVLGFFGGHAIFPRAPAAPWVALLLLLGVPVLARIGRPALGPRSGVAAAVAVALVAPMIALGAWHELTEPMIWANPPWCGTGRVMLEMAAVPAMGLAGTAGALIAVVLITHGSLRRDPPLSGVAGVLAAVAALLVAGGLGRAARLPEAERWIGSLPVVARVVAASGTPVYHGADPEAARGIPTELTSPSLPVDVYEDEVAGQVLRRTCEAHRCTADLVDSASSQHRRDRTWGVEESAAIAVHHDLARGLWVVEAGPVRAYRGPDLRPTDVTVQDVASSLSPPRGWIAGAGLGLVFAVAMLLRSRRAARLVAAVTAGREGTLEESGLLRFPGDDLPLRVAPGQALSLGPVVVLPGPLTPGGVYRGDGLAGGARIVCGSRDDLLAAAALRAAHLDSLAIAVIALSAAPLVVAALAGIVL